MYKGKQKLQVKVVTPRGTKVDERADMVILRCTTGDMGILPGHQPFSMLLDYGVLRMVQQDRERILAVYGGIAQVKGDQITILTDGADWPEEIDPVRAEADRSAERMSPQPDPKLGVGLTQPACPLGRVRYCQGARRIPGTIRLAVGAGVHE